MEKKRNGQKCHFEELWTGLIMKGNMKQFRSFVGCYLASKWENCVLRFVFFPIETNLLVLKYGAWNLREYSTVVCIDVLSSVVFARQKNEEK